MANSEWPSEDMVPKEQDVRIDEKYKLVTVEGKVKKYKFDV